MDPAVSYGVGSYVSSLVNQGAPIRFGFLFKTPTEDSRKVAKAFMYLKQHVEEKEALNFITSVGNYMIKKRKITLLSIAFSKR
jgi:hypothetical protein